MSDEQRAAAVQTARRRRALFSAQQIILAREPVAGYQELDKVGNLLGMSDAERKAYIAFKRAQSREKEAAKEAPIAWE